MTTQTLLKLIIGIVSTAVIAVLIICSYLGFSISGQKKKSKDQLTTAGSFSVISIADKRESRPVFEREYIAELQNKIKLKITIKRNAYKYYDDSPSKDGVLTQPNDNWIFFNPDKIAEKILDKELVPEIQKYVDLIYESDKQFRDSNPKEFTDDDGVKWRKVD